MLRSKMWPRISTSTSPASPAGSAPSPNNSASSAASAGGRKSYAPNPASVRQTDSGTSSPSSAEFSANSPPL